MPVSVAPFPTSKTSSFDRDLDQIEALAARGLRIMPLMPGAFGRDVHPSSTHGVLIRVYPVDSFKSRYQGEPDRRRLSIHREAAAHGHILPQAINHTSLPLKAK